MEMSASDITGGKTLNPFHLQKNTYHLHLSISTIVYNYLWPSSQMAGPLMCHLPAAEDS